MLFADIIIYFINIISTCNINKVCKYYGALTLFEIINRHRIYVMSCYFVYSIIQVGTYMLDRTYVFLQSFSTKCTNLR